MRWPLDDKSRASLYDDVRRWVEHNDKNGGVLSAHLKEQTTPRAERRRQARK